MDLQAARRKPPRRRRAAEDVLAAQAVSIRQHWQQLGELARRGAGTIGPHLQHLIDLPLDIGQALLTVQPFQIGDQVFNARPLQRMLFQPHDAVAFLFLFLDHLAQQDRLGLGYVVDAIQHPRAQGLMLIDGPDRPVCQALDVVIGAARVVLGQQRRGLGKGAIHRHANLIDPLAGPVLFPLHLRQGQRGLPHRPHGRDVVQTVIAECHPLVGMLCRIGEGRHAELLDQALAVGPLLDLGLGDLARPGQIGREVRSHGLHHGIQEMFRLRLAVPLHAARQGEAVKGGVPCHEPRPARLDAVQEIPQVIGGVHPVQPAPGVGLFLFPDLHGAVADGVGHHHHPERRIGAVGVDARGLQIGGRQRLGVDEAVVVDVGRQVAGHQCTVPLVSIMRDFNSSANVSSTC